MKVPELIITEETLSKYLETLEYDLSNLVAYVPFELSEDQSAKGIKCYDIKNYVSVWSNGEPFLSSNTKLYAKKFGELLSLTYTTKSGKRIFTEDNVFLLKGEDRFIYGGGSPVKRRTGNPLYDARNDGFVFRISPDEKRLEILVLSDAKYDVEEIAFEMSRGLYAGLCDDMRAFADKADVLNLNA